MVKDVAVASGFDLGVFAFAIQEADALKTAGCDLACRPDRQTDHDLAGIGFVSVLGEATDRARFRNLSNRERYAHVGLRSP